MKWTEHIIAGAISRQTLARKCVVLVDNCNWTGHECDVLAVTTCLRIIDVEVKISRADLKADAKKAKWWHYLTADEKQVQGIKSESPEWCDARAPSTHPRKVWKHYYAMPKEIWKPELLDCLPSQASGILLLREPRYEDGIVTVECLRRAIPAKDAYRLNPSEAIDIARLANLRMWESYRRLEAREEG